MLVLLKMKRMGTESKYLLEIPAPRCSDHQSGRRGVHEDSSRRRHGLLFHDTPTDITTRNTTGIKARCGAILKRYITDSLTAYITMNSQLSSGFLGMHDRSATKHKTTPTNAHEPSAQESKETQSPLNSEGPKTDKREERASIAKLLSEKLHLFMNPTEEHAKGANNERETVHPSEGPSPEFATITGEPLGFFARLREQSAKFLQIRSVKELLAWATETITGLFESAVHSLRFLREGKTTSSSTTPSALTLTADSPSSTTHGFTTPPTILEPKKDLGTAQTKAVDYTAQGITEVAEATRKAAEAKEEKAEQVRAEELQTKRQVRAQILAIDARAGGESPELQAIIDQLDGVYGSVEVALRLIMEAQAKELNLARKKAA